MCLLASDLFDHVDFFHTRLISLKQVLHCYLLINMICF